MQEEGLKRRLQPSGGLDWVSVIRAGRRYTPCWHRRVSQKQDSVHLLLSHFIQCQGRADERDDRGPGSPNKGRRPLVLSRFLLSKRRGTRFPLSEDYHRPHQFCNLEIRAFYNMIELLHDEPLSLCMSLQSQSSISGRLQCHTRKNRFSAV